MKSIGIISIKGGVGKTSVTSSLGAVLANEFKKKVLLVDANFTAPNLGLHLGLVNPEATLHHVLDGKISASNAVYETEYGFDLLPGALIYDKINPAKLGDKLRELRRKYDIILIDSSPNLNEEILSTMMASNELLVVTTPDYVTLASTLRAVKLAKDKRVPISGIILNKVYNKKFELSLEEIEEAAGANVLAVLPHEIGILEALSKNIPSTMHKKSKSTSEYKKLAASLIGEEYREKGITNLFRRFFSSVPKQEVNRDILRNNKAANPFYQ